MTTAPELLRRWGSRAKEITISSQSSDPDVFGYNDFRLFLRDVYGLAKERGLSYRAIAQTLGTRSGSFLKQVIDGERNLSEEMSERFAQGLGLTGKARDYFVELVLLQQAPTSEGRRRALSALGWINSSPKSSRPSKTAAGDNGGLASATFIVDQAHLAQMRQCLQELREDIRKISDSSTAVATYQVTFDITTEGSTPLASATPGGVEPRRHRLD